MKKILMILLVMALSHGYSAWAQDGKDGKDRGNGGGGGNNSGDNSHPKKAQGGRRQNKNRGNPNQGRRNNNQSRVNRNNLGSFNGNNQVNRAQNHSAGGQLNGNHNREVSQNRGQESRPASARFQKMGIHSVPAPIQNRGQILTADRTRSVIAFPKAGPEGRSLNAHPFAPRVMGSVAVQNHMALINNNVSFRARINVFNTSETRVDNYYWHNYNGFNYCHYYDRWGYHWYGWYLGSNYFWTRWYSNNWWWYDPGYSRWCYWHDGGWWWQDPSHLNVVYVYNNGNYTSVNAQAQAPADNSNQTVYQSNDGTRKVKVMGENGDAFLYDASNQASFDPVYLASGVQDVKFSNASQNRPLQIMLTLKDGSFAMFDANGNSFNNGGGNNSANNDGGNYPSDNDGNNPPNNGGSPNPPVNGGGSNPPNSP